MGLLWSTIHLIAIPEGKAGFDCGIVVDNFPDIKEKDIIEVYEVREVK